MPNSLSQTVSQLFRLAGGLNLVDPHITLAPGVGTFLKNIECRINGGYRRVDGYERFDGQPKPSAATYTVLNFHAGGNRPIVVGDVVVGATSGATGVCIAEPVLSSGSWTTSDGVGSFPIRATAGTFVNGEGVQVGGVTLCTTDNPNGVNAQSIGDSYYKTALRSVQGTRRALIAPPPGTGKVLGVFNYGDTVYCFRNAIGGATAKMWRSTVAGWVEIAMIHFTAFTAGAISIAEGQVLTKGANTATIRKVIITSGTIAAGTAAGFIWHTAPVPGNFVAGAATTSGGGTLNLSGANTQYSLLPTGSYEFLIYNFGGATASRRVYGVDGVNKGFEFDPTTNALVAITTGMTVDTPQHVAAHKNFLFFTFKHSVQWSGAGSPFVWSPVLGAAEIAMGDDITGVLPLRGQALAVFCSNSLGILYGSGPTTWDLKKFAVGMGSSARCVLELQGECLYFDNRGLFFLQAATDFGDFAPNAVSKNIKPLVDPSARLPMTGLVSKDKSHYRLFFNDKLAIVGTFYGGRIIGWSTMTLPDQFVCTWTGESSTGDEVMYAGTDDGYVMQLDIGTSFDGDAIESIIRLPFSYYKQPDRKKRFRRLQLEMQTQFALALTVAVEYDYGAVSGATHSASAPNSGGYWDDAIWNEFFWDAAVLSAPSLNIDGVGKNISMLMRHSDDIDPSYTLEAVQIAYSVWGQQR